MKRRKPPNVNLLEVRAVGSFGRLYLGGEERDIEVGYRAAVAAIEGVTGKPETRSTLSTKQMKRRCNDSFL